MYPYSMHILFSDGKFICFPNNIQSSKWVGKSYILHLIGLRYLRSCFSILCLNDSILWYKFGFYVSENDNLSGLSVMITYFPIHPVFKKDPPMRFNQTYKKNIEDSEENKLGEASSELPAVSSSPMPVITDPDSLQEPHDSPQSSQLPAGAPMTVLRAPSSLPETLRPGLSRRCLLSCLWLRCFPLFPVPVTQ